MSTCPHCKLTVGGAFRKCPLCQSTLQGEPGEPYWPTLKKLKAQSFIFKLILFIIISGICFSLVFDYLVLPKGHIHWSIPVLVWGLVGLWLFTRYFKNHRFVSKIMFQVMLATTLLAVWTEYYLGYSYLKISTDFIVPIICSGVLIANFVFCFLHFRFAQNTMLYLLFNILIGVIPYIALYLHRGNHAPLTWSICLLISIFTLIGIIIFKGRQMLTEIQKR